MRIKKITAKGFKRFSELIVEGLPERARLVILVGPNGSGKSSMFDAFRVWHGLNGIGNTYEPTYHGKHGLTDDGAWQNKVTIDFWPKPITTSQSDQRKTFYFRTAYRNEPDFTSGSFGSMGSVLEEGRISRFNENEPNKVSENYRRLIFETITGVYSSTNDDKRVRDLRDSLIGEVRESMQRVFEDLKLTGAGDPLRSGAFFFEKGISKDFHYKNLSAGEKSAFDLLLDIIVKRREFDDSVYCIDEPELHMHTKLQAALFTELTRSIPSNCQLWIATHSIGMFRAAMQFYKLHPDEIAFLDFHETDFDKATTVKPAVMNRVFWANILKTALDDLGDLVAPRQIVLCEGKPTGSNQGRAELDAACYRTIFSAEFPDIDFVSVGNASDVQSDRLEIGKTIQTIVKGTAVLRVVDRDARSENEIRDLEAQGVCVLSKRHVESYLMDDEILNALCTAVGKPEKLDEVLAAKRTALTESVGRGNPTDDVKSAAGQIYTQTKKLLSLVQCGNTTDAFVRDTLAPLVKPHTNIYNILRQDIFGSASSVAAVKP
jgi:predicted ATPase